MEKLGISLKIVTGDNKFVAARISQEVGLKNSRILTGSEINQIDKEDLVKKVNETTYLLR